MPTYTRMSRLPALHFQSSSALLREASLSGQNEHHNSPVSLTQLSRLAGTLPYDSPCLPHSPDGCWAHMRIHAILFVTAAKSQAQHGPKDSSKGQVNTNHGPAVGDNSYATPYGALPLTTVESSPDETHFKATRIVSQDNVDLCAIISASFTETPGSSDFRWLSNNTFHLFLNYLIFPELVSMCTYQYLGRELSKCSFQAKSGC